MSASRACIHNRKFNWRVKEKKGTNIRFGRDQTLDLQLLGRCFTTAPRAESPDTELVCHPLLCCAHVRCMCHVAWCLPISSSHFRSVFLQVPVAGWGGGGGGGVATCSVLARDLRSLSAAVTEGDNGSPRSLSDTKM